MCHKRSKREVFWHFPSLFMKTIFFFSSTAEPSETCRKDEFLFIYNMHFKNYIIKKPFTTIVYYILFSLITSELTWVFYYKNERRLFVLTSSFLHSLHCYFCKCGYEINSSYHNHLKIITMVRYFNIIVHFYIFL